MNREFLLREIQELQADFEDLADAELVECREAMLNRVNKCLKELGETDADNNGESLELAHEKSKRLEQIKKLNLEKIGNNVASLWGGESYNFEIDEMNEKVIFLCIEHGEKFITNIDFSDLVNYK